jgi:glucose/arabinose dehydrogenase
MRGWLQTRTLAIGFAVALALAACGGDDDAGGSGATGTASREATAAATVPAGAESTATAGGNAAPTAAAPADPPAAGGYAALPVFPALDFERMVGMEWMPGDADSAVVVTQGGVAYRSALSGGETGVFLDIRDRMIGSPASEEGFLGLAFDPEFESNGRFYVHYTAAGPRRGVISRFTVAGDVADASSERVVMEVEQPYPNHNGGALAFGPDGMLYIALGDGGAGGDPHGHGQNTSTLLGSILRVDVSGDGYTVPGDNPFVGGGGAPEIWAYGLRNPWRITFDSETGALWAGDVGQGAWEEVDLVERGGNYGWNVLEGHECYAAEPCDRSGKIAPRAVYPTDDGCAVTGGYVYRGDALPELRGWYVYGDFCGGQVWALNTADNSEPVLLASTGQQIPSFAEGPDGELYLLTFGRRVFRLGRAG